MTPTSTRVSRARRREITRQARFVASKVILSTDVDTSTWYDVCAGRRRSDDRPGMVLLDLGSRREHFPASCLEFRAPPAPEATPLRAAAAVASRLPRLHGRALAAVVSLIPIGAAALVAAYRIGAGSRG